MRPAKSTATAGSAAGTGAAFTVADITISTVIGAATGTGSASNATATTSGNTTATAPVAAATGTANSATVTTSTVAPASVAAGTGAASIGLGVPRLSWGVIVVALGGLSAVLGVLYALMQHDLKRLLAYHSVENIGIILLGLGAGMMALAYGRSELAWIGVAASLYHVLNHAVFKGLLFLGAGDVVMTTGTRQIEQFGGLLRRMPWTGAVLSHRCDGDFRPATSQRVCERVADVPGVPVRFPRLSGAARALPVSGRRCAPGADDRPGGGVFRQGIRDQFSRVAAQPSSGRRARGRRP